MEGLPHEMVRHVLEQCDHVTQRVCRLVCRRFNELLAHAPRASFDVGQCIEDGDDGAMALLGRIEFVQRADTERYIGLAVRRDSPAWLDWALRTARTFYDLRLANSLNFAEVAFQAAVDRNAFAPNVLAYLRPVLLKSANARRDAFEYVVRNNTVPDVALRWALYDAHLVNRLTYSSGTFGFKVVSYSTNRSFANIILNNARWLRADGYFDPGFWRGWLASCENGEYFTEELRKIVEQPKRQRVA
jgi:hypothetical protein